MPKFNTLAWRALQVAGLSLLFGAASAQPAEQSGPAPTETTALAGAGGGLAGAVSGSASEASAASSVARRSAPDPACAQNESLYNLELPASGAVREIRFGQPGQRCLQAAGAAVPWVSVSISRQSGSLRLVVSPNPSTQARQTEVQVVHNNDSGSIWVTQAGALAPVAAPAPAAAEPAPSPAATAPTPAAVAAPALAPLPASAPAVSAPAQPAANTPSAPAKEGKP